MNSEKLKSLLKGLAKKLLQHRKYSDHTGGTNNSRYCYSIWMRHLYFVHSNGLKKPEGTVAELGPGDSLGLGLAALLSGFDNYYALDVYKYWNAEENVKIFDELVALFKNRTPIPDNTELPRATPSLANYSFPSHILTDELLERTLAPARIDAIRNELRNLETNPSANKIVHYFIPWNDEAVITPGSVDFIFSQAVLQYVDDLDATYQCMKRWLKKGGVMSHSIDFSSHGITPSWNGHWTFSPGEWKLAHGNNKILLNRAPLSYYLQLNEKYNFEILNRMDYKKSSRFGNKDFHSEFRRLPKEDVTTFVSVMISKKAVAIPKMYVVASALPPMEGLM